jgi:LEA14-like dessication related protein
MKRSLIFTLSSILFLLSSCKIIQEVKITSFQQIQIKEFNRGVVNLTAIIEIDNPNLVSIEVDEIKANVFVAKEEVGKLELSSPFQLDSRSRKQYAVDFKIDLRAKSKGILPMAMSIMGAKQLQFEAEGTVSGKAFFIRKTYPLHLNELVPVVKK